MECIWDSDLPWLSEGEQDFPLGAKATSFLTSATELDFKHDTIDLPDWMESKDIVEHPFDDLQNDTGFPDWMESNDIVGLHADDLRNGQMEACIGLYDGQVEDYNKFTNTEDFNKLSDTEDFSQTIKLEDMLVPLSELQPEKYAPKGIEPQTLSAVPSVPKISIRVNKVKVEKPEKRNNFVQIPYQVIDMQQLPTSSNQQLQTTDCQYLVAEQPVEGVPNCNADELLNELVDLANSKPNTLTNLITSFDSSFVQAGMDDLLSQLETNVVDQEMLDASEWQAEARSPISVPSPVPSVGSLSPLSTNDSFHQLPQEGSLSPRPTSNSSSNHLFQNDTISNVAAESGNDKEYSFASLLSPSVDGSSVSSPLVADDEESESDCNQSEIHSYSRSPRKSKANRKSSSSGGAYPEGRKERKKEQNKQAALRYRQKKKQEDDVLMSQVQAEEKRQKQLKAKYAGLKQELSYLKKIMREVLIAKGTLSAEAFQKK